MSTVIIMEPGTSSAKVELVSKEVVPHLWPILLEIVEEKGKTFLTVFSEEELFRLLCHGVVDLWIGIRGGKIDGFTICGWEKHDRALYYHVLYIMGKGLSLYFEEGLEKMERYALGMGATEVVIEGRWGWQRMLERKGYVQRTVRLRKNVRKHWGN